MPATNIPKVEIDQNDPDQFIPDPDVCREFSITAMTLARWTNDPYLRFPPPMNVRHRNFRSRRLLEEWKAAQLRKAIAAPLKVFAPRRKRERA